MKRLVIMSGLAMLVMAAVACGGGSDDEVSDPAPTSTSTQASSAAADPTATTPAEQAPESTATAAAEPEEAEVEPIEVVQEERTTGQFDGVTFMVTEGSEATFTVEEQLVDLPLPNDAVLRTTSLSGEVHFDGRSSTVEINLRTLSSDQTFRDGYVRNTMFRSDPTGLVTLVSTLPLPDGFAQGQEVSTQIETVLTILGRDVPLTFDIEARDDGDVVFVLGRTQFTWEEVGIRTPRARSVVSVADEVRVEVLLALEPVTGS